MNILIVNCVYDPEPVVSAQIAKALAEALAERNYLVSVIAPFPSRPDKFLFDKKYNHRDSILSTYIKPRLYVHRLPSFVYPQSGFLGRLKESISFGLASYQYIKNNSGQIDEVYMNTWPLFAQFGVAKACKEENIPYVIHVQDMYPESLVNKLPRFLGRIIQCLLLPFDKYNLKFSKKVIAISANMKQQLIKTRKLDGKKVEVIYNWQDGTSFTKLKKTSRINSKFTFTYLGNIGPVAGVQILISAFQRINRIDLRLVIAGDGSAKQECIELASQMPELDVQFMAVPAGAVAQFQEASDILLLPVIKGGGLSSIPSKLPAYMLSAKPIIATVDEESDTAQSINEAGCGWVGKAEDVDWLAKTMVEVSSLNPEYLNNVGSNGREYCLTKFSKEVNLEKMVNLIINRHAD